MKLATFETITEISPIEGADRIELARVQGWQSVIKKGEYKVGDKVIFVPIDTVMKPEVWNKFLWNKEDPRKPIRVKTVKLRGVVSQGLIFPTSLISAQEIWDHMDDPNEDVSLAGLLGITKYERPMPANLAGLVAGDFPSHFISKTDEDNLKSNINVLEELKEAFMVQATIKMDGTSATYIKDTNGKFHVCSRNLELKETENNVHWQIARKYDLANKMPNGSAIQGEICGPSIQKNPVGLKEPDLFVFNYKDLNTNTYYRTIPQESELNHIPHVQVDIVWHKSVFKNLTIDDLQKHANLCFYENKTPAEGIVLRGLTSSETLMYSKNLQKMLSVKILNQNYKEN